MNPQRPQAILAPSVFHFLDLWRVIAATLVLALHFQQKGFFPQAMPDLYRFAHLGVVIFFVISGYSVSYSAQQRAHQPLPFLIARLSRLYSVVVPTLILALLLDHLGGVNNSELYPTWQYHKWWLHLGFNLAFLGETWGFTLTPFSIIPYWSLAYEFWFYILLAATMLRPGLFRTFVTIGVLLIMGPRIWMLLPCWLLGVWAYAFTHKAEKSIPQETARGSKAGLNLPFATLWISLLFGLGLALWFASGADAALIAQSRRVDLAMQAWGGRGMQASYSKWFLGDYGPALLFTGALLLASRSAMGNTNNFWSRGIAWLAPHTFGIYLLHYTLITLAAASIPEASREGLRSPALALLIVMACLGLSLLFDRSRPVWTILFKSLFQRLASFSRA